VAPGYHETLGGQAGHTTLLIACGAVGPKVSKGNATVVSWSLQRGDPDPAMWSATYPLAPAASHSMRDRVGLALGPLPLRPHTRGRTEA
jgi:hypothetical protein